MFKPPRIPRDVLPALYCLLMCFKTVCGAGGEDARRFVPRDVFDLEFASDPRISPDGERVAYVRNFMDIMTDRQRGALWVVSTEGAEHRPVVAGRLDISSPRWSPDGSRLAWLAKDEDSSTQIFVRWLETGETAPLTRVTEEPRGLAWSPDGRRLAFSMRVPEKRAPFVEPPEKPDGAEWADPPKVIRKALYRFDGAGYLKDGFDHLFVLPAEGGTPRQVTSGDYHHREPPVWTPDGKSLVFSANRHDDWEFEPRNSELYEVSLEDGGIEALTDRDGPDSQPAISPDGKRIAYVGFDDRRQGYQVSRLYVMDRDGGETREITGEFDRDVGNPMWNSRGDGMYFQFDDHGVTNVGFATLDGDVQTVARHVGGVTIGRPYASGSFTVSKEGLVAFTETRPQRPADVAMASLEGSARTLTRLNDDVLPHKTLAEVEEFTFASSYDGREIQGWIVKPPEFNPKKEYPLVLEIHGGPFANYGQRFSAELQLYAAAGYVVLYVNPRGSTGYGAQFGNLIHHAYPGHDYDDLMSGVDALLTRGYVNRRRLFVTGGSGGGVLTSWVVGKTDRFRAAVAAKPVINWYSFVLTADAYPFFAKYWFGGLPWEDPEAYLKRSPLSLVGAVTTPTMLLTGEADYRTPMSESEQFYQALKLRGVETALVRVPGASHNIAARPSHLIAKVAHVLKWFEMHDTAEEGPGKER